MNWIAGGYDSLDEITVIAPGNDDDPWDDDPWGGWDDPVDPGNDWGDDNGGSGGGGGYDPGPPADEASIDVVVNINRPLTAAEQAAVDSLKATIAKQTAFINSLSDTAKITLPNGQQVTGAELKEIWSKTDFQINEVNTTYRNGTTRGEADYNGGDPKVGYNIDIVTGYKALSGGMDYLTMHELGHMTQAGRNANANLDADGNGVVSAVENDANERVANDIAQAIVSGSGGTVMANPGGQYSGPPLVFQ